MNDTEDTPHLVGHIDNVTEDGVVTGWSWDPSRPERRVDLTVLIDNMPVGTATAANFRADLKAASIGDGKHALVYIIPWELLGQKRSLQVSLRDAETGRPVGQPFTLLQKIAASLDDRLGELEGQVRLLQSRCDELLRLSTLDSPAATSDLFESIGAFFVQLAEDAKGATPHRSASRLGSLVETAIATYPTLTLPIPELPVATIYIDACAPLDNIYNCISSLYSTKICELAHIVLLDAGKHDDAALVPTLVRNIRYYRIWDDMTTECNKFVAQSRTEFTIFVSAGLILSAGWLDEIVKTFAQDRNISVVGGKLVREDGLIQHSGLFIDSSGRVKDWGAGQADDDPTYNTSCPVDGFGSYAFAVRQSAFREMGGFDPKFRAFADSVLDLCLKLRALSQTLQYQPLARATWLKASLPSDHWVAGAVRREK